MRLSSLTRILVAHRIIGGYFDASSGTYVDFIATVPEPSTFVLAGLGLCSLLGCGRKRYKYSAFCASRNKESSI